MSITPWMATAITDLLDAEAKKLRPGEDNVTALWPVIGGGFSATSAVPVLTSPSPTRAALRAARVGEGDVRTGTAEVAEKPPPMTGHRAVTLSSPGRSFLASASRRSVMAVAIHGVMD